MYIRVRIILLALLAMLPTAPTPPCCLHEDLFQDLQIPETDGECSRNDLDFRHGHGKWSIEIVELPLKHGDGP